MEGKPQYVNYEPNYYGSATAEIEGNTDVLTCIIPTGTALTSCTIDVFHPNDYDETSTNYQAVYGMWMDITSTNNFDSNIYTDSYGNDYTRFVLNTSQTSDFEIQQGYSCETEANLSQGFTSSSAFPTGISNEYTQATTNIQSNDPDIVSKGVSLTSGCTTMQEAVRKIAEWVIGTIDYASSTTNNNSDEDASEVFDRKTGNCTGFTNLMIALLRSVNIPARFVCGAIIRYPFTMPYIGTTFTWGNNGPGVHAVYEVNYPDQGWCIADPQTTLNFNTTHFVKYRQGTDNVDRVKEIRYSFTGTSPIFSLSDACGTITSFDNNYQYNAYSTFSSQKKNRTLLSVAPAIYTGIYDKVEITSGTQEFKTGESVNYHASFTSGDGSTYVTNWYWRIILYHSQGAYVLKDYNGYGSNWGTETPPLLPSYNWLLDSNDKIFGEVVVTVAINDGDYKQASFPVSVDECVNLSVSNQTYSSNTTKQGCYVTLNGVSVQNNSKLTIDSEMGVTIEKNFSMQSGTQLEVN